MSSQFRIEDLPGRHLEAIVSSHGWINLAPAERIENGFKYSLILNDGCPVGISVSGTRKGVFVRTDCAISDAEGSSLRLAVRRMLSIDFPLRRFRALCRQQGANNLLALTEQGWGRLFRSPTAWEDAVKTLFTTNASWAHTQRMCARLCEQLGSKTASGTFAFPSPNVVARSNESFLRKHVGVGYRAPSLLALADLAASKEQRWLVGDGNEPDRQTAYDEIGSWPGFGAYATAHLMVLLGFHDYLPVDREVAKHLGIRSKGDKKRIRTVDDYDEWGEFRFTAYKLTRVARRMNWIGD